MHMTLRRTSGRREDQDAVGSFWLDWDHLVVVVYSKPPTVERWFFSLFGLAPAKTLFAKYKGWYSYGGSNQVGGRYLVRLF